MMSRQADRVMPDYKSETLASYLVCPSRRHLPGRTRVVIDFLIDEVHQIRSRRTDDTASPDTFPDAAARPNGVRSGNDMIVPFAA